MIASVLFRTALLLSITGKGDSNSTGPCETANQLHSLSSRVADYKLKDKELPVTDYYLLDGWYSMGSYVIASTNVTCGALFPWHIEGSLPDGTNEVQRTACNSDCTSKKNVSVLKCPNDNYVFNLVSLETASAAFCIDYSNRSGHSTGLPAPVIHIKPTISAEVKRLNGNNNLHFYCDFTPQDNTLFYTVEWSLTSGFTIDKLLHRVEGILYSVLFREKAALNEQHLNSMGVYRLPFTIVCSVTAQQNVAGKHSVVQRSDPKFCGIKLLSANVINLNNNDEAKVEMQLTVPFGCSTPGYQCMLNVDVFVPKETSNCELPQLRFIPTIRKQCGVTIHSDKYNTNGTFTVRGIIGDKNAVTRPIRYKLWFRTMNYMVHPLFSSYTLEGTTVMLNANRSLIDGKRCYSHNDPHMLTFEGIAYENQVPGTYILYKHNTYELEVQVASKRWTNDNSLNCGIAIRAGRDVFVYSICNSDSLPEINFRMCDDGVLHNKVRQIDKTYKVYLPSGTVIEIQTNRNYVNFDVIPSVEDIESTTGLCGTIDKSRETPNPINYRVTDTTDLFNTNNYVHLKSWSERSYVCRCGIIQYIPNMDNVQHGFCNAEFKTQCHDDRSTVSKINHVCAKARKRRHTQTWNRSVEARSTRHRHNIDTHFNREASFPRPKRNTMPNISKRQVYDNATARADCMSILNTTAFQKCSNIPNLDVSSSINNCVADAMLTNSMDWSITHLEAIKGQCIHHVRVNQPLSAQAQAELHELSVNENDTTSQNDSDAHTTAATVSTIDGQQFTFSDGFLQEIQEVSCLNECSGHGKCVKGECVCDADFIDIDCSVDVNQPPIMNGIPDFGLCDRQLRQCQQTSVFGEQIVESANPTCKLVRFTVNPQSELDFAESTSVSAEVMSLFEVRCPLPTEREKRDTSSDTTDTSIASGYKISISNNGQTFSDEDIIVVFDSKCVNCTKNAMDVVCRQKPGYCARGNECYSFGDQYGCNMCGGDDVHSLQWIPKMDCPDVPKDNQTKLPEDNQTKLWIIAAVLVPVFLLVILVTLIICCKTGQKGKGSQLGLDVIPDSRPNRKEF